MFEAESDQEKGVSDHLWRQVAFNLCDCLFFLDSISGFEFEFWFMGEMKAVVFEDQVDEGLRVLDVGFCFVDWEETYVAFYVIKS